ncbi:MAG: hypothetical protein NT007_05860, partial [Candidatus Kapabacteria bacterium]|nr:hypothetical protein [Candidatus Kapabacteria bacterium]
MELYNRYYGEFCDPWSYTTGIKVPLLASPADSVTNQPINLTIKWNNLINDAKQHLQVSKDPTFKTFLINDSSLSAVSYDLKNLEYYTKYYWRASNVKGSIQSFWSSTWAFKTTIPTPVAVYPAKGDTTKFPLNFNISWNQVPNATLYHFQISTDPTFADIVKDTSNMVDIFIKMDSTLLKYNTTYYCHVDAKNKDSQTPYSEIFSFTTKSNINKSVRDNIPEIGSLSAYPNPFAGELRITLNLKKAARVN